MRVLAASETKNCLSVLAANLPEDAALAEVARTELEARRVTSRRSLQRRVSELVEPALGDQRPAIGQILEGLARSSDFSTGPRGQLAATPVSAQEVVFGKMLPYLGIGLVDVVMVSGLGVIVFDVPFRGDPVLLMLLSTAFLIGALGLGMFISSVARSQLLATQLAMISTFLPAFLLSGFMFDIQLMPSVLRAITYVVPARYFLVVTRGIFLKGVSYEVLYVQGLLMILFAFLGLLAATKAFRKEIE